MMVILFDEKYDIQEYVKMQIFKTKVKLSWYIYIRKLDIFCG